MSLYTILHVIGIPNIFFVVHSYSTVKEQSADNPALLILSSQLVTILLEYFAVCFTAIQYKHVANQMVK